MVTRRELLATTAGLGAVGLAGCSGLGVPGSEVDPLAARGDGSGSSIWPQFAHEARNTRFVPGDRRPRMRYSAAGIHRIHACVNRAVRVDRTVPANDVLNARSEFTVSSNSQLIWIGLFAPDSDPPSPESCWAETACGNGLIRWLIHLFRQTYLRR